MSCIRVALTCLKDALTHSEKAEKLAKQLEEKHEKERLVREAKELRLKELEEEREKERCGIPGETARSWPLPA